MNFNQELGGEIRGKTLANIYDLQLAMENPEPEPTFWERFTETRFSWLDVLLAILILTVIPAFILSLIPW